MNLIKYKSIHWTEKTMEWIQIAQRNNTARNSCKQYKKSSKTERREAETYN